MQERNHTGEGQQLVISPRDTASEMVHFPETDTLPIKTMTMLQSVRPGVNVDETTTQSMEGVTQETPNPAGSV